MSEARTTTDHDTIRKWAEERGGRPATVKETADKEPGILRIDFYSGDDSIKVIEWDEFFRKFDEEELAFIYQDRTDDGSLSRFSKFVSREEAESKR